MDWKLAGLIVVLAAAPASGIANERAACVEYAEALISGRSKPCGFFRMCGAEDILTKAHERGYTCEPMEPYLEIAKARLAYKASLPPPAKTPYRFDAPQVPTRERTTCKQVGHEVVCETQ